MPRFATSKEIATKALKHIGAFGVNDLQPDAVQLARALEAFDALVQEYVGTNEAWWLRPGEVGLSLTAAQASYDLMTALGASYPVDWIEHPVGAVLVDPNGNRTPLTIVRRDAYYGLPRLDTAGIPECVYLDRLVPHLTLYTHPVIAVADYTIRLSFQTYAPNSVDERIGAERHGLPPAWERWGSLATAYDISGGSVMNIPIVERQMLKADLREARAALDARNNRERARKGHVQPRDF